MWFLVLLVALVPSACAERRVAVCVSGAMRSLVEEEVWSSMEKFFRSKSSSVDVFFYLFTGVELSARGQRNISEAQAGALEMALRTATAVQFQTSENEYTCGQMATGKFFKVEMCANLIAGYMRQRPHKRYDVLVLARPDASYDNAPEGAWVMSYAEPQAQPWFRPVGDELYLMTFKEGLTLARNMTKARCCDLERRIPPQCFLDKQERPRANYIALRHFNPLLKEPYTGPRPYLVIRTKDQIAEISGRSMKTLHGVYREDIARDKNPAVSPPYYDWSSYSASKRQAAIRRYLRPPRRPGVDLNMTGALPAQE